MLWNCVYNVFYDVYSFRLLFLFRFVSFRCIFYIPHWILVGAFVFLLLILYLANVRLRIAHTHTHIPSETKGRGRKIKRNPLLCLIWQSFGRFYDLRNKTKRANSKQSGSGGDFEFWTKLWSMLFAHLNEIEITAKRNWSNHELIYDHFRIHNWILALSRMACIQWNHYNLLRRSVCHQHHS